MSQIPKCIICEKLLPMSGGDTPSIMSYEGMFVYCCNSKHLEVFLLDPELHVYKLKGFYNGKMEVG